MSNRALNIVECIAATLLVVSATVLAILDEPTTPVVSCVYQSTTPVVVSRVYQCPTCPYQWYTYYSTVTF